MMGCDIIIIVKILVGVRTEASPDIYDLPGLVVRQGKGGVIGS